MRRYDHIVFDIDGTLIDTKYAVMHGLQDTVRELTERTIEIEQLLFSFGIPGEDALRILGMPDPKAALALWNRHIRKYWNTIDIFSGISETLNRLAESGIAKIGIVTSKTRQEYEVEFCRFDISRLFSVAVTADDTERHKPEPEPLMKYMELTGAQPGRTLYVGDSEYDMRCAKSAGVDGALALWGAVNKDVESVWRVKTPAELLNIMEDLSSEVSL